MKKLIIGLIAVAGMLLTGTANALSPTGNDIYNRLASKDSAEGLMAYYYIDGVLDAEELALLAERFKYSGTIDAPNMNKPFTRRYFCVPAGVKGRQIYDVVLNAFQANPQNRHEGAFGLIRVALMKAWPCQQNPT